jgi:hypothetical protein
MIKKPSHGSRGLAGSLGGGWELGGRGSLALSLILIFSFLVLLYHLVPTQYWVYTQREERMRKIEDQEMREGAGRRK